MNNKQAKQIIKSYRPTNGFFDLSEKPEGLSQIEYAKILESQNLLVEQNKNCKYLREFEPIQWDKLREFSASLQRVIFRHWAIQFSSNNDY